MIRSINLKHIALTVVITMKYIYVYTHNRNNQEVNILGKQTILNNTGKTSSQAFYTNPFGLYIKKYHDIHSLPYVQACEKKRNKGQA